LAGNKEYQIIESFLLNIARRKNVFHIN